MEKLFRSLLSGKKSVPTDENQERPVVEVGVSLEFLACVKKLKKRYKNISSDIRPYIRQLELGESIGDQIPGVKYPVFKVRVENSDAQRGKSGGYRFIYYLKTATKILLVTIYSKSDFETIPANCITELIEELSEFQV